MRNHRSHINRERGAVAAEFAIILPLLLILIFGIIQFGLLFQRQSAAHAAAREAARVASLPTVSDADAESRCLEVLAATSLTASPACAVVTSCDSGADDVVVEVTVENSLDVPFFGSRTFTITGSGEFRCE